MMQGGIGKNCTSKEGCTHHNLFCAYPNCEKGKADKKKDNRDADHEKARRES